MARATSSLPVPLSPVISTGTSWAATRPMALYTSRMAGQEPTMAPSTSGSGGGLGDHGRLAHPPGHLQRLADHAPQLVQVERLEQVVVGPLPHRLDGRVRRLGHGDEDDRDARVDPADLLVDVQAGLVGQAQVEENDVGRHGRTRSRPSAPVPATSTRCAGAGNAWRTCSGIRAGSSSMSNRWATIVPMPSGRIKADHALVRGCGTPTPCAATWALRLNVWHSIRNLAARYRSLPDNHRLARAAGKEERVEKWGGF